MCQTQVYKQCMVIRTSHCGFLAFNPSYNIISISYVSHQHSAQTVLEENERIFSELLLSIERKYNEVKEMIRSQEKTTVTRGEILLDRMEEEITLLRKKHTDLEKLSHTDDHIHFLQVRSICTEDPKQHFIWCKNLDLNVSFLIASSTLLLFTRAGSLCRAPQDMRTSTTSVSLHITPLMLPREPLLH